MRSACRPVRGRCVLRVGGDPRAQRDESAEPVADGRDRADGGAVIAAHRERNFAGREALVDGVMHAAAPRDDLGQMAVVAAARVLGITRAGDVASVDNAAAEPRQGPVDTGHP